MTGRSNMIIAALFLISAVAFGIMHVAERHGQRVCAATCKPKLGRVQPNLKCACYTETFE